MFEKEKKNKNNMSYWLGKVADTGFAIPETLIHPLPDEWSKWLVSDNYKPEKIAEFNRYVEEIIKNSPLAGETELFMKTGNFSNKFLFHLAHLMDFSAAGGSFLSILYDGLMLGCDYSPEIVLRKFIHTDYERPSIYQGMKLNTEFRVFYDFSAKKVLGVYNYWETETMLSHLNNEEHDIFESAKQSLEKDFQALKGRLQEECESCLPKANGLYDIWSVDFLWDGNKFWLIDMAIGMNSYYYSHIMDTVKELPENDGYHAINDGYEKGLFHGWLQYGEETVHVPVFSYMEDCILWALWKATQESLNMDSFRSLKIIPYAEKDTVADFSDAGSLISLAERLVKCSQEVRNNPPERTIFNFYRYEGIMQFERTVPSEAIFEWFESLRKAIDIPHSESRGILASTTAAYDTRRYRHV